MNDRDSWDEEDDPELEQLLALDLLFGRDRPLPDDLDELLIAIRDMLYKRMMVEGATDTYPFEGYEAYDVRTGGMGFVIEARDPELDRKVAIKLWARVDPRATEALLAEAKTLAKLSHPNVVTVYATGRWRDRVYFVMEWVEGQDGHKWLEQAHHWREVRDVFVQAGEGLAAAHDAGIQHRDFKPSNMLIGEDGRVLVADFGIAASLGVDEDLELDAREGRASGTPIYMAPERLRGGPGDARSDQFSFCVALWRGLHGYRPFSAATVEELIETIEAGGIRPSYSDAEVPHWLSRVVRKGLEAEPERRWADMRELLRAMQDEPPEQEEAPDIGEDEEPERPEGVVMHSPSSRPDSPTFFRGLLAGIAGTTVVMVALLGFALLRRSVDHRVDDQPTLGLRPSGLIHHQPLARAMDNESPPDSKPEQALPGEPRVTPQDVLDSVAGHHFDTAHHSWDTEAARRETTGVPTYADSLEIGSAFLMEARTLANQGQLSRAKELADTAAYWGHAAVTDLRRHHKATDEGDSLLADVEEFKASLRSIPGRSK